MEDRKYPDWREKTAKEHQLESVLVGRNEGPVRELLARLVADPEINLVHSYANAVSIRRLGYNDHGPVHARITTYNALKIFRLLHEAGVPSSLQAEEIGSYEDSQVAVALGCFLHDFGMAVTRDEHEWHSIMLADAIIQRYIAEYCSESDRRIVIRALVHEIIVGHMAHSRIHSIEAGVVLVADGTDLTRGRSRIPLQMELKPAVGDMHRFSAGSITRVEIAAGELKPVRISVFMEDRTGLFQIEEVLMAKVKASPIIQYLEIAANVNDQESRFYLR